jgi:hypothetical protein
MHRRARQNVTELPRSACARSARARGVPRAPAQDARDAQDAQGNRVRMTTPRPCRRGDARCAYVEYFSGRVGSDDWMQSRELDFDNAREALQWAPKQGAVAVELRVAATLLRALPSTLHVERMTLAAACDTRVDRSELRARRYPQAARPRGGRARVAARAHARRR